MSLQIESKVSPYISSQFPRFYREYGPGFIEFLKTYFEWLETEGNVYYQGKKLLTYRDIDTTLDQFLVHWKDKYLSGFPETAQGDKRFLIKHVKELYAAKGTEQGLKLLFRLLYDMDVNVYYPGDDILRVSDGVWTIPQYLEVSINSINPLLVGETVTGRLSGARAIVEDFQIQNINNRMIHVLMLSNIHGTFSIGETLNNNITNATNSPIINGSLGSILMNEAGFNYKVGDVLDVVNGSGRLGSAIVRKISPRNGVVTFEVTDGGSGYSNSTTDPNNFAPNIISIAPTQNTNPGLGATFQIGELSNTFFVTCSNDVINTYASVTLGASDYGFPADAANSNINTALDVALNIQTLEVGSIKSLTSVNPGSGYNGPVAVSVRNYVIAGLDTPDITGDGIEGLNAQIAATTGFGTGAIDQVQIRDSGIGYLAGDVITLVSANNIFIAGGTVQLGSIGVGSGYWEDNRGFLDSDKYIQDSYYYQSYSYEVQASVSFDKYASILKNVWHLAGTQSFGRLVITDYEQSNSGTADLLITTY